jgi:hypothetical protein
MRVEDLSKELEALGGGDHIFSKYKVVVWSYESRDHGTSVLRHNMFSESVQNAQVPLGAAQCDTDNHRKLQDAVYCHDEEQIRIWNDRIAKVWLPFAQTTEAGPTNSLFEQGCIENVFQGVCESFIEGFSQAVVSFGQTATGKSTRLLGRFAWPAFSVPGQPSLLSSILKYVLSAAIKEHEKFMVGISCWELCQNQVRSSNFLLVHIGSASCIQQKHCASFRCRRFLFALERCQV